MNNSSGDDVLKQYITQLFANYDTQKKGSLNFQQLNQFFADLLKTVGIYINYNYQQLYGAISMADPNFNGNATPQDVYKIFKAMLTYGQTPTKPQQQPQTVPQTVAQPQYHPQMYPQMQGQYMNPAMYSQYMGLQGQGQMGQMNGQVWGYNNYMGMNPYGYRQ